MGGLNFEEQPSYHPGRRIEPILEIPSLTQKDIENIRNAVVEMKINDKRNPHWDRIDPGKLTADDLYAFKKVFLDKNNCWESESCEEFKAYHNKVHEDMGRHSNSKDVFEDPRYSFYEFLKNQLIIEAGIKRSAEKKKEKEKSKAETIH